jgi:pantoate--beta-alanine ligase
VVGVTEVAHTRAELANLRRDLVAAPGTVRLAVVMTMGALHAGHAQLIREARRDADVVIVTIFLNPLQFAPGEDLTKYPRTFDADLELCRRERVDVVFAPTPDVVYPHGEPLVRISAGPVGDRLEGTSRPGHFDGVLTVVAKLLNLTAPDVAYFGQKDAQQLWLITQMVSDLDLAVRIVAVPTVRDDTGLALSSRNGYLSATDRDDALVLSAALRAARREQVRGRDAVLDAARSVVVSHGGVDLDYLALVDPQTFDDLSVASDPVGPAWLLIAARVGPTRLIDNIHVRLGAPETATAD